MGQTGSRLDSVEVISLDHDFPFDGADLAAVAGVDDLPFATSAFSTDSLPRQASADDAIRFWDYSIDNSKQGTLGEGSFATVKLATNPSGHKVAVKIIKRKKLDDSSEMEWLQREVKHQNLLRHDNIVRLHTWLTTPTRLAMVTQHDLLL